MSSARAGIVCIGLARTGEAVVDLLRAEGRRVTVVEEHPDGDAYPARAEAARTAGATVLAAPDEGELLAAVAAAALVIPSPGVRPTHPALVHAVAIGVPIRSELDIAAERITSPMIAVTGTNGKTTTTDLTTRMLAAAGCRVVCAGNIGTPLAAVLDEARRADAVVVEVSSFQLEYTTAAFRPRVAVLLNVASDHLDWHGSFAAYAAAKAKVFAHQGAGDALVVDVDDAPAAELAARARSRIVAVTSAGARPGAWCADDHRLLDPAGRTVAAVGAMPRALPHDRTDALCAAAAVTELGVPLDAIASALARYEPMAHRVQLVTEAGGVRWYDDSKATNPHATLRGVAAFDSVVLLAGGLNKGVDLDALRAASPRLRAVVAFGASAGEIEAAFAGAVPVERAGSMRDAVQRAGALAVPGDVVLLSPGCASFDMYPDGYAARGDDFAREAVAFTGAARQTHDRPLSQEARG